MPPKAGIQKGLVLAAFLAVAVAILLRVNSNWSAGARADPVVRWKFSNCFVSKYGLLAVLCVGGLSWLIGHPAIREVYNRTRPWPFAKLILAVAGVNALLGLTVLGRFAIAGSVAGRGICDYLKLTVPSVVLSATCTVVAVLLVVRAESIPNMGKVRLLGLAGVVLVTGYLFASLVYMGSFTPVVWL